MDIFIPIVIIVIFFVLFSVCGWCFKRKREGTVYQTTAPIHQHIQATPQVVPPYPIDARHPTPQAVMPPAPGFTSGGGYQAAPYPQQLPTGAPYPTQAPGFYYPPSMGTTSGVISYPPQPMGHNAPYPPPSNVPYNANPPSYTEAVGHPPVPPVAHEKFAKQAPYNPNY